MTDFSKKTIEIIGNIPSGRVMSYGQIAAAAGNPRGARQVSRLLHSASSKYKLPWHRVVNSSGRISLPEGEGREEQISRLIEEGVEFSFSGKIDLNKYLWRSEVS